MRIGRPPLVPSDFIEVLKEMYVAGFGTTELQELTGIERHVIGYYMKREGVIRSPGRRVWSKYDRPGSGLTRDQVRYATNSEYVRSLKRRALERKYHVTEEEVRALEERQGGLCAICHQLLLVGKKLNVDHDHKTGKVRGLLCGGCNFGLGHFHDDPALLEAAAAYLRTHQSTAEAPMGPREAAARQEYRDAKWDWIEERARRSGQS